MSDDGRDPRLEGFPPAGVGGWFPGGRGEGAGTGKTGDPAVKTAAKTPTPRFLVLGSFPSAESLRRCEYYGHPRNGFWSIFAWCAGLEEAPSRYPERIALLERTGVALWDIFAGCRRRGSADSAISAAEPNPVLELLALYPSIESIGLNGGAAAAGFARYIKGRSDTGEGAPVHGRPGWRPVMPAIGENAVWDLPLPAGRRMKVWRLPSTSPVPTARFRTARDKFPAWKAFFTIHP